MRTVRACVLALAAALVAAPAFADIFTWTDASGRVNISNVTPPKDAHARRIVQAPPKDPQAEAARAAAAQAAQAAAQAAEVQALQARVAELESEVDAAKRSASAAAAYRPPPAAPPVVVVAPPAYAPPPVAYAPLPDYDTCNPFVFGCPAFGYPAFGYPLNVVVIDKGKSRFHRFDRFGHDHRARAVPGHPAFAPYRR